MGVTLTDVLLFGKAQSDDVDNATLVIYRRNILRWSALGGYLDIIVKGVSPLSLPDAIADSLSYVKAFGGTEQRNLPSGFTELEYIQSDGTQWIDTGITPRATKLQVNFKMQSLANTYQSFFGAVANPTPRDGYRIYRQESTAYFSVQSGSNAAENVNTNLNNPIECQTTVNNGGRATVVVNGVTSTVGSGMNTQFDRSMLIFTTAFGPDDAVSGTGAFKLWSFQIIKDDEEKFNGIPAKRNSDNVIGMYDTVSGRFFTNAGTGTFVAGPEVVPTPDAPMNIMCNNGVLKYGNVSKNLFDEDYGEIGSSFVYKPIYLGVGTYTCSYSLPQMESGTSMVYFLNGNVSSGASNRINQVDASTPRTITTSTGYVTLAYRKGDAIGLSNKLPSDYECMIEKGSTATPYEPYRLAVYTDGTVETIKDSLNNTATAEMLLKIGDYQDVQEILAGDVTRKVGIKVFDGTEDWASYSWPAVSAEGFQLASISDMVTGAYVNGLCSHFVIMKDQNVSNGSMRLGGYSNRVYALWNQGFNPYSSPAEFKQYLAEQYAAGTPVIVIYPLATATTESVTGQTLQVQAGDNTLEITQASITGLELEAQYQAAVSLTIQEVQDANLDPNVEVTIN